MKRPWYLDHGSCVPVTWGCVTRYRLPKNSAAYSRKHASRVCIYVGHMVVSTVLGPPWSEESLAETSGGFHPLAATPLSTARESSWVFNEISGPSVPRPTPSSSSTMDKASQPAHCPYVLHGGRYRSLPRLSTVRCIHRTCTCRTNSSPRFCRPTPRCVTIIENTRFLATQHHMVAFKIATDHISLPECLLTPIYRPEFFIM